MASFSRLILNTALRFVYPFAPALSRGMGVPVTAITSLIAINQLTGLLSLIFGPISDRWGYRTMLLLALGIVAGAMTVAGIFPIYAVIVIALPLVGVAKSIFDPALHAYAGQYIAYEKRGLAIGLMEMSWAGASLVGIPLMGYLISNLGWRSSFLSLGSSSFLCFVILGLLLPRLASKPASQKFTHSFTLAWRRLGQEQTARAALLFGALSSIANDNLFVVYGLWLEELFGLGIVALGLATSVIGIAELAGEGLTALLSDRLGLKKASILSLGCTAFCYALLLFLQQSLTMALIGLFLVFLTFEFNIVTTMSLFTEILPDARATMMSGYKATSGLGRMVGALIGVPIWLFGGMLATGMVSALVCTAGLLVILWGFRDWKH